MKDILQYVAVPIVTALITAVITYLSTKVNNKTKMELAIKDHEIKLQELNNDDAEDGDLIHTDDEEKADEDGFSIIAMWNWERKNYFIKE